MGSIPHLAFTGVSRFSSDFQVILDRALAIARLPLRQIESDQGILQSKKQSLADLQVAVSGLADALERLGKLSETKALAVSTSNSARVTASLNGATNAAVYTITEITSVARAAAETSILGYATADSTEVSTDGILELAAGSDTYTIDLTAAGKNNLTGLRDAINALGAGVTATILNTGMGDTPYYLAITATATGETTLQLRETAGDAGSNILTQNNQGANAVFKLNGLDVVRSGNVITDAAPGLSFTIVSKTEPGETVTVQASSSREEVAMALGDLAVAYNALAAKVKEHVGEQASLLSGDYIIREIQSRLRALAGYGGVGGSGVNNLADLGIEFDSSGVMSVNTEWFDSLSDTAMGAAYQFLGSAVTGLGGLSARFKEISDPATGLIRTQQDSYDTADARLSRQIDELNARIEVMYSSLSLKLQQADALLARLESQQTMLQASIEGLNLALYGRRGQ